MNEKQKTRNKKKQRNVCTVIDLELVIFQNVNTIVMRNSAIFMSSDSR